ncbi:MAG: aldolase [Planctomycetes bacterium]|nr:aldolase [Planctomycetota bacterium]
MLDNKVRQALKRGETVFGTMISGWRSSAIAQIFANVGFDFMFIDTEHADYNMETVSDIIRMARMAGIAPLVRVTDLQYPLMSRPLDAGAQGLMIPRLETKEQVEEIVQCMKYPPVGKRGCATGTGHSDYKTVKVKEFMAHANENTLIVIQIEQAKAVENVEAMVSVPGVDVALVGPNDLSIALGCPGEVESRTMTQAIDKVIEACNTHHVAAGIHIANIDLLKYWMRKGMRMITYSSDVAMVRSAASDGLKALKAAAEKSGV